MKITDFTFSKLVLIPIGNKGHFKLADDLHITVNAPGGKGWRFILRKDFVTYLGSVPNVISGFIPKYGDQDLTVTYVLHDAFYTRVGLAYGVAQHLVKRDFADKLLRAMLTFCDECTQYQINILKETNKTASKEDKKHNDARIKALKGELLGSAKTYAIYKAVDWFGRSAYEGIDKPPCDQNYNKISMEVL
ncbi:MAG: DUF1353 domain-containing protein [Fibromonadaceae bacterium]|jgi:hypothetical protein|nr:DUF1353 domain-containing protein [Fibromonadaceae bacterium]